MEITNVMRWPRASAAVSNISVLRYQSSSTVGELAEMGDEQARPNNQSPIKGEMIMCHQTKSSKRLYVAATAAFASILLAGSVTAQTVVRESFKSAAYPANALLRDLSSPSATGFTGNWSEPNSTLRWRVAETGLQYPGLKSEGLAARCYLANGGARTGILALRALSYTPVQIVNPTQLYIGFLVKSEGADLKLALPRIDGGDGNVISFDFNVAGAQVVTYDGAGGVFNTPLTVGQPSYNGVNLFLMRVSQRTSTGGGYLYDTATTAYYDKVEIWLNPNLANLGAPQKTVAAIISKVNGVHGMIGNISLDAAQGGYEAITFDEFFMTTNLADVLCADADSDGICDTADNCVNVANPTQLNTDSDSAGDACDGCVNDPAKTSVGQCGCGVADTDTDNDGTANCNDLCINDPYKSQPGLCGCGVSDSNADTDGDTVVCFDPCPTDPNKTEPGICGCGVADTNADTDGDSVVCNDPCPTDPFKTAPGICGCGVADTDSDSDGVADCQESCDDDPTKTEPGICGCGVSDTNADTDGDSVVCNDPCPADSNKTAPGQCGCGVADTDSDGDGTANCNDACSLDPNKIAAGICGCGTSDVDADSDGTPDCNDLCINDPLKTAPGQCGCGVAETDSDSDGTADCNDECDDDATKTVAGICGCGVADTDGDGDGTADCNDACPSDANKVAAGICGCGVADVDMDGDGTADCNDDCPADSNKTAAGICGCGVADTDSDSDGNADCNDGCPADANKNAPGICGCGVADTDSDSDGTADCQDACPADANKVAPGICGCDVSDADTDADGVPNCVDACVGTPAGCAVLSNGCDPDTDSDGVRDCSDACPTVAGNLPNGCYSGQTPQQQVDAACPCNGPVGGGKWKNKGDYVSCVAKKTNAMKAAGTITDAVKGQLQSTAAKSACGSK